MSFAAGFQLGNRMVGEIEDSRRQKVLDERAAKEFARKEQEWSRADAERADVDRAISEYRDLSSTGQAVAENTSGFSAPSARMLYAQGGQQAVDDAASYANAENRRFGLTVTNRTSLPDAPDAAPTPTVKMRQATPLDRIKGLEGIALARKDVATMERLGGQRQVAEEDMFIADAMKSYKGTEDQVGGTANYINTNSKRVTMGPPGKNGFVPLSIVKIDGRAEFLNLSKQDQAKLYAAGQLMERNPTRALEIMSSVNKELASAIAQENGLVDKLATNANDVAYKGGQLGVAQQNANTNEAYRRQLGAAASARAAGGGAAVEDFQRKVDGVLEGYQAAVASGSKEAAAIYAREYDQLRATAPKGLRVPPALSSLNNAQKTQGSGKAFEKLPEQGTVVADGNGTRLVYSDNGYPILPGGADPYNFGKVSAERGVDQNMLELGREKGLVSVHEYGRHITLGDKAYDITNKSDVAAFNAAMRKIANEALAEEERIRAQKYPQLGISGANELASETNRSVLRNIRQNTR